MRISCNGWSWKIGQLGIVAVYRSCVRTLKMHQLNGLLNSLVLRTNYNRRGHFIFLNDVLVALLSSP